MRFCEPVINADYAPIRDDHALTNPRSVALVSNVYDYRLQQLRDLTPGGPNVAEPPYNNLPPPHLLLGYQYMHRTLNDYMFTNRVFMQLSYDRPQHQRPSRLYWTCLTDCSYPVNVGAYMRFLDLDNFHGTFEQMHNAVLMDRVVADMRSAHLAGRGADPGELNGHGASGLRDNVLMRMSSARDAALLTAIRKLRVALCHYMFQKYFELFDTEEQYRYSPGSEVFLDDDWLTQWTELFSAIDTQELLRSTNERFPFEDPTDLMTRCLISTLAGDDHPSNTILRGGAINLRNRRVTDRRGLRARDARGRAITAADLRRQRPRAVRRFIDRLPLRVRRPPAREEVEMEEPAPPEEVDEEETLFDEIVRTVVEAIAALQQELTGTARQHALFQFTTEFYRLILSARNAGIITEPFLRKWVLYFFLAEHVASTLYHT